MDMALPSLQAKPTFKPAGFWLRFLATIIDSIILSILLSPITIIFAFFILSSGALQGADTSFMTIYNMSNELLPVKIIHYILGFFYFAWFYKFKGATLGKMLFNMKVVNINTGENLSVGKTFLREIIGKFIAAIILLIGFIMAGFREDKRGLHDFIGESQVLRRVD